MQSWKMRPNEKSPALSPGRPPRNTPLCWRRNWRSGASADPAVCRNSSGVSYSKNAVGSADRPTSRLSAYCRIFRTLRSGGAAIGQGVFHRLRAYGKLPEVIHRGLRLRDLRVPALRPPWITLLCLLFLPSVGQTRSHLSTFLVLSTLSCRYSRKQAHARKRSRPVSER